MVVTLFGNRLESDYPNSPLTYAVRAIDQAIFPDNTTYADLYDEALEPGYSKNYGQALADGSSNIAVFAAYTIYDKETITPSTLSKKEIREKLKAEKKAKKFERKKQKMMNLVKKRLVLAAGIGAGGVLLIILLVITSCAGICLMILGADAGSVILGAIITAASIFGIVKIAGGKKRKSKTEP